MTLILCVFRELREKEEIEKYRMERPKIQQQFSDLKVCTQAIRFFSTCDFITNSLLIKGTEGCTLTVAHVPSDAQFTFIHH